jgi:RNA 3'-terminal phosphate cyclase-like protein
MAYKTLNGHLCLRERLVLSFISKNPIYIKNIRYSLPNPGLRNFEIDLLSLIDKVFHDCLIEINETGTHLKFTPGHLKDGDYFHNTIGTRGLSYYLEFLIYLVPSVKNKMNIKIIGLRSLKADISLETFAYVNLALLRKIGARDLRLRIISNSISKTKNTEVILFCPKTNLLNPFRFTKRGLILALQIVFTTSSNSILSYDNLFTILPKKLLDCNLNFRIHNFKIFNRKIDFKTITLLAETSTGCILSADSTLTRKNLKFNQWVEFYRGVFSEFLEQLVSGNCIDGNNQVFFLINFLGTTSKDESEIKVKKLTLSTIYFLRETKHILGSLFKIKYLKESKKIIIQKKTKTNT